MKATLNTLIAVSAFAAFADAAPSNPQVKNVEASQDESSHIVTVKYDLDSDAIVTMDVLTNGVSIGPGNIRYVSGDCNRIVSSGNGKKTIQWRPHRSWPNHELSSVTVKVNAWAKDAPPDVLVVDLNASGGPGTQQYYEHLDSLPDGLLGNDVYRKSKLVMRRIHAADVPWTMGCRSDAGEEGRQTNEREHNVTLAEDYYIGVFPVTQRQWQYLVNGNLSNPSTYKVDGDMRPVETVSFTEIRGAVYPNAPTGSNSFIKKLNDKTGLSFDLPSEAQWEFACRAGTGNGVWNNGVEQEIVKGVADEPDDYGYVTYKESSSGNMYCSATLPGRWTIPGYCRGTVNKSIVPPSHGTSEVGSYEPNAWGLYDMHGNVWEVCLDKYKDDISQNSTGAVITEGTLEVRRGGGCVSDAQECRSAYRGSQNADTSAHSVGFRLTCSINHN